jgi:hypothetical protein
MEKHEKHVRKLKIIKIEIAIINRKTKKDNKRNANVKNKSHRPKLNNSN